MTVELKPIIVNPDDEILSLVGDIKRAKELIKTVGKQQEVLENRLYLFMKEQEELKTLDKETGEEVTVLTWKTTKPSKSFDKAAFQKAHPKIYSKFEVIKDGHKRLEIK